MAPHFQLRIKSLKYISAVDRGAQGPISNVALIKRAPTGDAIEAVCKVASIDEKQGLVFGWALATTLDGGATPHVDLQQDAIIGDDELIKVAAEFMEASAASDVLHDDKPDGRVVFCMPLTSQVNAALGIKSDTHGLAIAMRPSPETFKRFVSKELNAFSIGGTGERIPVTKSAMHCTDCGMAGSKGDAYCAGCGAKHSPMGRRKPGTAPDTDKRVGKMAVLTSETEGHAHSIDLDDPADGWSDKLSTSSQTATGATESHSHAWIYDAATGAITIAPDSGHTHTVAAVVPADVLARAKGDAKCARCGAMCDSDDSYCPGCGMKRSSDGVPSAVENEPGSGKAPVIVISARAPVSTPPGAVPTVKSQEQSMATPEEKIAEIEKRAARFEKMSTLTDAARAHFGKLAGNDAETFLAKSAHEREVVLAEIAKADEVVYESPIDGSKYRKSDDVRLINTAKALAESVAKQRAAEASEREAVFAKRGDEVLKNFPTGAKKNLRGRIMKALNAEFADPAEYEEAVTAMKGMNAAFAELGVAKGVNTATEATDASPAAQLEQLVKRHATENKVSESAAYVAVLDTAEGARLYAQQPVGRA